MKIYVFDFDKNVWEKLQTSGPNDFPSCKTTFWAIFDQIFSFSYRYRTYKTFTSNVAGHPDRLEARQRYVMSG